MVTDMGKWARDMLREDALMEIARHCEMTATTMGDYPNLQADAPKFKAVAEAIFALYAD